MRTLAKGPFAVATLVLSSLAFEACELPDAPPQRISAISRELRQVSGDEMEVARESRIQMSLEASGKFVPGLPISLSVELKGRRASSALSLDIDVLDAPDFLEPALKRELSSLARGSTHKTSTSVTFANEGYYRVLAHARASRPSSEIREDSTFTEVAQELLYIRITRQGGYASTTFDRAIGRTQHLTYGSFGPWLGARDSSRAGAVANLVVGAARRNQPNPKKLLGGAYVDGYVKYHDPSIASPQYVAVPGGLVSGRCEGISANALWYDMFIDVSSFVGSNGYFFLQCPDGYDRVTASYYFSGLYSDVSGPNGAFNGADFGVSTGTTLELHVYTNASVAFRRLESFGASFASRFGRSRPRIKVWVWEAPGLSNSNYCFGAGPSCPQSDLIRLRHDQISFEDGLFTVLHEYGHAFHFVALRRPATNDCGLSHTVSGPNSRSCAFVEGFADFASAWIGGDSLSTSQWADYFFEQAAYNPPGANGMIIEGAVAAFLYDLVDGAADRNSALNTSGLLDDSILYPGVFVGDIVATCQTSQFGTPTAPAPNGIDGIDQFVACAERSTSVEGLFNPATGARYLGLRFDAFTVAGSLPSGYSSTSIRSAWIYDLFKQGSLP
jgi:hypothetical protein